MSDNSTILFVDDEQDILNQYGDMLEMMGYQVIKASGGSEALEYLENKKGEIDLILLDLMMPGISGTDILEILRKKGVKRKYGDPEIIVLTNLASEKTIKRCLKMGASGYLIKTDSSIEEMKDEISRVLDI